MSGGKKQAHSESWQGLMDLVQDAKYGSGNEDETVTPAMWEKLEHRWGRGFTPAEREEVKDLWARFHQEMEQP